MEEQNPNLAELKTLEGLLSVGNCKEEVFLKFPSGDEKQTIYDDLVRAKLIIEVGFSLLGGVKYQLTDRGRQVYQEVVQKLEPISPLLREIVKTKD